VLQASKRQSIEKNKGVEGKKRTIHGPAIERDATGRRESRAGSQCLAWNVKWSMASRRLSFRPEFGTQLEADLLISAKTEGHLVCTFFLDTVLFPYIIIITFLIIIKTVVYLVDEIFENKVVLIP